MGKVFRFDLSHESVLGEFTFDLAHIPHLVRKGLSSVAWKTACLISASCNQVASLITTNHVSSAFRHRGAEAAEAAHLKSALVLRSSVFQSIIMSGLEANSFLGFISGLHSVQPRQRILDASSKSARLLQRKYRAGFHKRQRKPTPCMGWQPTGLLREAVEIKKLEVELMEQTLTDRPDHPVNMRRSFFAQKSTHRFSSALRRSDGTLAVVAAIKRFQAPKLGGEPERIADLDDIARETREFECAGADAAYIYTDSFRYGIEIGEMGKISNYLRSSTTDLGIPLARQDLIIDPVQIAEAAEAGASAVNIIAGAVLPELMELLNAATMMGIEAIVECHTTLERDFAMECGATMIYLTNWDRTRNIVIPGTAEKLAEDVPPWVLKLGGGGLTTAGDCWKLLDKGFNAVVLGKTFLQTRRRVGFLKEIRSQKRHTGDVFTGNLGTPFSEGI